MALRFIFSVVVLLSAIDSTYPEIIYRRDSTTEDTTSPYKMANDTHRKVEVSFLKSSTSSRKPILPGKEGIANETQTRDRDLPQPPIQEAREVDDARPTTATRLLPARKSSACAPHLYRVTIEHGNCSRPILTKVRKMSLFRDLDRLLKNPCF